MTIALYAEIDRLRAENESLKAENLALKSELDYLWTPIENWQELVEKGINAHNQSI